MTDKIVQKWKVSGAHCAAGVDEQLMHGIKHEENQHLLCVEAINVQYSHLFDYRAFPGFTSPWKQKEVTTISWEFHKSFQGTKYPAWPST